MAAPILQIKRGNAGIAGTIPALRAGEPAFSYNNFDLFVGFNSTVSGNKFFGSHRYWGREDGTDSLKLKLVDKDGTNGIHLKSPNTSSGIGTYTLPDTNTITNGYFLKVATDGTLSWGEAVESGSSFSNATLTGITTITGNLYVNGSTTQVNTASLTVEDRTIDLGIVNGAAPVSTTTWDLGILFNYFQTTAKKSALIWEQTDSRFKFASVLNSDTEGSDANTPQLTVTTFAPIEIAELWVNNTCTGGPQQVIGCIGAELSLQNINIDSGYY